MSNTFLKALAQAEAYNGPSRMKMEKFGPRYRTDVDRLVEELGLFTEALENEHEYKWEDICVALERVAVGLRKAYEGQQ
jgi:hypothetical protein